MKYLFLTILFGIVLQTNVHSQKTFDLVKDFGAKADNKTDSYNAFVNAANAISAAGGGVLNIPKGKYYIDKYKIEGGEKRNGITDVFFKNCNGLVIKGNGSTIRVNGKFTRKADFQRKGLRFDYSYTNTVCPFALMNCKNILIQDIELYGEVDKMQKDRTTVEGSNYGIKIVDPGKSDTSSHILIANVITHHFATDGIMIGVKGKDIDIVNCKSYCNARQGLSIVRGSDIRCISSDFDSTGNTGGKYGWHNPKAGIDIEAENGPGTLYNIKVLKCNLRGNAGFQIVSSMPGENIQVDSCFISDKTGGYSSGLNGVGIYSYSSSITNSIIFGTIQVDISDQRYVGEKIQRIENNIIYSGVNAVLCADMNRPVNISNNIIIMLPDSKKGAYLPFVRSVNCVFVNNVVAIHPDKISDQSSNYLSLMQRSKQVANNFWLINRSDPGEKKANGHFFNIAFNDSKNIRNQFFPDNAFVVKIRAPGKKLVAQTQLNAILSNQLFTAFHQKEFDKKYLSEAALLRQKVTSIIASAK